MGALMSTLPNGTALDVEIALDRHGKHTVVRVRIGLIWVLSALAALMGDRFILPVKSLWTLLGK
jgi:hypothetical protein